MGKRSRVRRRGRGSIWTTPSFRYKAKVGYRSYDALEKEVVVQGRVADIINDPSRTAPVVIIEYNGKKAFLPAWDKAKVGDIVQSGVKAEIKPGNILPLTKIPDGTFVYNIELQPGDGGKVMRSAGASARVVTHEKNKVIIHFPNKKFKTLDGLCRATIGMAAGTGRREKPFIKAGKKYHAMKARGRLYPVTSAVAMNVVDHIFGGKRRSKQKGPIKPVSRRAPPGKKVGIIASKRTGRKKKK